MINKSLKSFPVLRALFCLRRSGLSSLFLWGILTLLFISCQSGSEPSVDLGKYALGINDIVFSPSSDSITIQMGDKITINAEVFPNNAAFQKITWESSSTAVIRLSSSVGKSIDLTPVSSGQAFITASAGNKSKSIAVTVRADKVIAVRFSSNNITLSTNTSVDLSAIITPSSAINQNVSWFNSDTNIVKMTISNNTATVKGITPGSAIITVTTADGGWQASATVTVKDLRVNQIALNTTDLTIEYQNEWDTGNLIATVQPADALNKSIDWQSSDPNIATVTNGIIYPVKSGTVTIKAISKDNPYLTAQASVTIVADWLIRISLTPASLNLQQTSNAVVKAIFYPISALNTNIIWNSWDRTVATVSNHGDGSATITGEFGGTASIMAWAGGKNSAITVSVTPDPIRNFRQTLTCSKTSTAELVWDAYPGAERYEIYQVRDGTDYQITSTAETFFTASGLTDNTYYVYKLKACAGPQCTPPSSLVVVTGDPAGNNLAAVIGDGNNRQIPANLNTYDKSVQDAFDGYSIGGAVIPRYVTAEGYGDKSGTSWSNAADNLKNLLDGITDAAADKVYVVLLGPGVYQAGNEMAMKNYVTIVGGISPCNTIPVNVAAMGKTTLSGENSYRVFNNNNINSSARLYGVTIADGETVGNGGGMYNLFSSPVLTKVTFSQNTADLSGGGMFNYESSPSLKEVVFSGNTANVGGGLYNERSSSVLTSVVFANNTASVEGGGMQNFLSSIVLTRVIFSENKVDSGSGGGMNNHTSSVVLTGTVFSENTASVAGGGMRNYESTLTVLNSIFWGNQAKATPNQIDFWNTYDARYTNTQENMFLYNSIVEGGIPAGYVSGDVVTNLNGGGFSSAHTNDISVNFSGIITTDPNLESLADDGNGKLAIKIPTGSSAKDEGLYVQRSESTTGNITIDGVNIPTYTLYYSDDNVNWFSDPGLATVAARPPNSIDLTAVDITGYSLTTADGRPDIGVYEER